MICRYCGKKITDDSVFCPFCGKDLTVKEIKQPKSEGPKLEAPVVNTKTNQSKIKKDELALAFSIVSVIFAIIGTAILIYMRVKFIFFKFSPLLVIAIVSYVISSILVIIVKVVFKTNKANRFVYIATTLISIPIGIIAGFAGLVLLIYFLIGGI